MASQPVPAVPLYRNEAQEAAMRVLRGLLFVALALAVVVPHSFQLLEAAVFLFVAALCAVMVRRDGWLNRIMITYFLGVIVTAIYVWVGYVNGAPRAATNQTLFIYIVSPFMWIMMSTAMIQFVGLTRIVQWLIWLTWLALFSIAAFFYLFLTIGPGAVRFLIEDPNVNVQGGFAAATLLVYGSMIFLSGAIFAQPDLIRNKWARIVLPGLTLIAAITSGRSAFILAIPVGLGIGIVLRARQRVRVGEKKKRSILGPTIILGLVGLIVMGVIDFFVKSVDLLLIFQSFWDELMSAGGSERAEQSGALWEGFLDSYGLGFGHGKGVQYIRNVNFPWRYEVMPLATLVRVGLVGTLVYMSTFMVYGRGLLDRFKARDLSAEDIYMIGGFVPAAIGVATNPYIESFVFQWMYFLPVMSLGVKPIANWARREA
ncbi:MAG: hypothetical protein EOP68_03955 [Sphingomonas sp.]|nr:MAG: hypothetical protein EOP68_03955 [Sphingomonas sp.]